VTAPAADALDEVDGRAWREERVEAELVIFDCDGVLVDSEVLVIAEEVAMLGSIGIDVTADDVAERYTGRSDASVFAELRASGIALPGDFEDRWTGCAERALARGLLPVAGIADLLTQLSLPRCVASSSLPARIDRSLTLAGLHGLVGPHVFSTALVARGKPAPDIFLRAAERLGVQPASCVVLEDSAPGIRAALAAGMTPIMVPDQHQPAPDILASGTLVLPSLAHVQVHLARAAANGIIGE
jgi:beta-phosphoglucomutase-like phosphatase (HAD superfamily)